MSLTRLAGRSFLVPLLLWGCQNAVMLPEGRLAGPGALAVAPGADGKERLFIANADGGEVRVFDTSMRLFVRGPNAISPLSILVGMRPTRLAAGAAQGPGGTTRAFVIVAGASRRVATIDATSLALTEGAAEAAKCAADPVVEAPGCLRGPVVDVAATTGRAVAVVGGPVDGGGLAVFAPAIEEDAPVLSLSRFIALPGAPEGVAVSSDGLTAWVADRSEARLFVVNLAGGTVESFELPEVAYDVYPVPAYVTANGEARPADRDALLLLRNGRFLPVSLSSRAAIRDPFDDTRAAAPLWFGTPANDLAFVPCPTTDAASPCRTTLRANASLTVSAPLLGFVALADGNLAAIEPDASSPMLFRPIDLSAAGPVVSAPTTRDPDAITVSRPTVTVVADSLTPGVTSTEIWTLAFEALLPGFTARPVSIEADGSDLQLVDGGGERDRLVEGDAVRVRASAGCPALVSGVDAVLAGWDDAALRVTPTDAVDAACLPLRGVVEVRAIAPPAWVLTGSTSGFTARVAPGVETSVAGRRSYYPAAPESGPAFAFTLGTEPIGRGATVTFSTASGLEPFTVCQVAGVLGAFSSSCLNDAVGFASGVAATPTRLYGTLLANPLLLEVVLPDYGLADGFRVYR